jgi:hypothetical protein
MNIVRHALNIIAILLIVATSCEILLVGWSQLALPFSIFVFLAGMPGAAHISAATLAWWNRNTRVKPNIAALGLSLSSVAFFVWLGLGSAAVESIIYGLVATGQGWRALVVSGGVLLLIVSSATNFAYFYSIIRRA